QLAGCAPCQPPWSRLLLAGGRLVLVHVPEGAVVDRVDGEVRVVAPARVRRGLNARPVHDRALAERHLPERVAGEPPGIADPGVDARPVDHAVAGRDVALAVLGNAPHPAM